jgi:hypothetical protein
VIPQGIEMFRWVASMVGLFLDFEVRDPCKFANSKLFCTPLKKSSEVPASFHLHNSTTLAS